MFTNLPYLVQSVQQQADQNLPFVKEEEEFDREVMLWENSIPEIYILNSHSDA
jgi:hypothetical protein